MRKTMPRLVLATASLLALLMAMAPAHANQDQRTYATPGGAIVAQTGAAIVNPSQSCDGTTPPTSAGGGCFDHNFGSDPTFKVKVADASGLRVPLWIVQRNSSNTTIGFNFYCPAPNTNQNVIRFPTTTRVIVYVVVGDGCANQPAGSWGAPTTGTITLTHP